MAGTRARVARAERAEATRARIVAAAAPLFVEQGYLDTTMSALARAAGVAVQTLYLSFGGKAAVLEAALVAAREDEPIGWPQRLRDAADGPAALDAYVRETAAAVARAYPLTSVLAAAAADAEPADLLQRLRDDTIAGHSRAVDELADKPGFTDRISIQRATEVLTALVSPEVYGLLVAGQHWTVPDWAEWAARHAVADLFPAAPPSAAETRLTPTADGATLVG